MTIEELKDQISSFTTQFQTALEKQTQAILECRRIESELEKLQNELSRREEITANSTEGDDEDREIIELEAKFERLKLELILAESEAEIESRRTHARATEGHIRSLVAVDENVVRLRNRLVDGKAYIKTKKAELQRERKARWEQERQNRLNGKRQPAGDALDVVQQRLCSAKRDELFADDEVEVLRKKLETLGLLVALVDVE